MLGQYTNLLQVLLVESLGLAAPQLGMGATKLFALQCLAKESMTPKLELAPLKRLPACPVPPAVCNNNTLNECKTGLVFGLPSAHWCYVQYVRTG